MSYRSINGIGVTVKPIPSLGKRSIAIEWFIFLYIPIIPFGFVLLEGVDPDQSLHFNLPSEQASFRVIKKLSLDDAKRVLGWKGIFMTGLHNLITGLVTLIAFVLIMIAVYFIFNR